MEGPRDSVLEPDAMDLVSARMTAMNATIEDLEDGMVLLKQALQTSKGPTNGTSGGAVPAPMPVTGNSKHEKRSKKTKAKSMIEMPGAGIKRRHASNPDLMNAFPPDADSSAKAPSTSKPKHRFGGHSKSRSKHAKDATVSEDELATVRPRGNRDAPDRLAAERKEMSRTHSTSGAKAMFESLFHRRPSHTRSRASTATAIPANLGAGNIPPVPPLPHAIEPRSSTSTAAPLPDLSVDTLLADLTAAIENMRHQHSSLLTLLPLSNFAAMQSSAEESSIPHDSYDSDATEGRISPTRRMDLPARSQQGSLGPSASAFQTATSQQTGHRSRQSLSSLYAEVASVYYDAEIEPWDDTEERDGQPISHHRTESRGSFASVEVDKHVEQAMKDLEERDRNREATQHQDVNRHSVDTVVPSRTPRQQQIATFETPVGSKPAGPVIRRSSLPYPSPASEPSLIGMLRKNVGKDLSTITFDVTFNEPLSLLQKLAEEVEYVKLLDLASQALDPIERIAHVAAFAVSQYANSKHRTSRKPFNPLQGESYELVREDLGLRFISEKVTHHPPRMACFAEGKGWTYSCTSSAKNKLSGMSLEIQPLGTQSIVLNGNEGYSWTKPKSYMRNLVAGAKYLETIGDLTVHNDTTGEKAVINFEAGGWAGKRNQVTGICYTANSVKAAWLDGVWDSKLNVRYGSSHDPSHPLWLANPWPPHTEKNYGFTHWAIQLNELTPDLVGVIAPSDSRLRPDQRAYEEGRITEADHLKTALEEAQRQRKQTTGEYVKPRWFQPTGNGSEEDEWTYAGGYFESRSSGTLAQTAVNGLFDL